jgi:hypothetical protein
LERCELQVEIAQDVDTHDRINLDLISVSRLKPLGTPISSVLPRILRSRKNRPHTTQINMARLCVRGALRSDGRSIHSKTPLFHSPSFACHLRSRMGAEGHLGHVTIHGNLGGQSQPA